MQIKRSFNFELRVL